MIERTRRVLNRLENSPPGRFFAKWNEDNGPTLAIVIAYYGLFSMFPLLLTLSALLGFVVRDPGTLTRVEGVIWGSFPPGVGAQLSAALLAARKNAGSLGLIGAAGLIWSGSGLFGGMEQAFDNVYRVPLRGLVAQRGVAIGMTLLFTVLIALCLAASFVTQLLVSSAQSTFGSLPDWALVQAWVGWAIAFLSLLTLFLVLYLVVPNTRESFLEVLPGAVLAATLFGLATQLVPIYLRYFGGVFESYAAFGLLLLVMFWFWVLGNILVLGAELNAFLARPQLAAPEAPAPPKPASLVESAGERSPERDATGRLAGVSVAGLWAALLFLWVWDRLGRKR